MISKCKYENITCLIKKITSTLNQMLRMGGEREIATFLSICNLSDSVLDPTIILLPYILTTMLQHNVLLSYIYYEETEVQGAYIICPNSYGQCIQIASESCKHILTSISLLPPILGSGGWEMNKISDHIWFWEAHNGGDTQTNSKSQCNVENARLNGKIRVWT